MSASRTLEAKQLLRELKRHPRIAHQGIVTKADDLARLQDSLPALVAFGSARYSGALAVVDWDHRLPSKSVILRVYAYYTDGGLRAGTVEMRARSEQIAARDKFPEFDVPDYAGLNADEAYEAELDPAGTVSKMRLVSPWRREIEPREARTAVQITRGSDQFRKLADDTRAARPDYLGDLESVSWTPPCESNLQRWTVDVWYLMYLDASVGKGRSFLVDLERQAVVGVREFVVRAS